jgi:hypothetical protein
MSLKLEILHKGQSPPCMRPSGQFCRGCPGWRAMALAASPGGAWEGSVIHCPCTGLTARGAETRKAS